MKILAIVPAFNLKGGGGVANQYEGLRPYWKEDVEYMTYGQRRHISGAITFFPDLFAYIIKLMASKIDVVLINPSLRKYQLFRDGLYLIIARFFGKKVVTFIHGWDPELATRMKDKNTLFKRVYSKSSLIFVLYSKFKNDISYLNVPILLSTTKVEDSLLEEFDIKCRTGKINNIMFLARVDRLKRVDIVIKAFELLKKSYPELKLNICGEGDVLQEQEKYVKDKCIEDVIFHGHVISKDKIKQLTDNQLYILPTTHGEGMATTVLEAMAFGMPVITRPVGGIVDFFENGRMGYLLESLDPEDYAEKIKILLDNPSLTKEMSNYNYDYAKTHFLASEVALNIENNIKEYCR